MMTALKTTSRDRTMFALILLPILALIVLFASAGAKWRTNAAEIRPMLLESFASDIVDAPSPMAADYDAATSTDQTQAVRELFVASSMLNEKYQILLDIIDDQKLPFDENDREQRVDKYIDDYLVEAQPLLTLLEHLQPSLPSVWLPHEFDNPRNWISTGESYYALLEMLKIEYLAAIRAKDADGAIRAFRLFQGLGVHSHVHSQQLLPVVAQTMAVAMWTAEDLEQMDQLLTENPEHGRKSQEDVRNSQLTRARWLLYGTLQHSYREDTIHTTYAPSRRIHWLERRQAYSRVGAVDSTWSLRKILEIDTESTRGKGTELDVAIQFPNYGGFAGGGSMLSGFLTDTDAANQRRYARTAAAVATFHVKFDSYPKSLDDLNRIGFPMTETLDPLGRPFNFDCDENGCDLGNASVWFSPTPRYPLRFTDTTETLATILGDYEIVEFHGQSPPQ